MRGLAAVKLGLNDDYKKSFGGAIRIITGLLEPIVSVKEDEVLPDVLNKNLEDMCSDIMDEGPRMISNAFLECSA